MNPLACEILENFLNQKKTANTHRKFVSLENCGSPMLKSPTDSRLVNMCSNDYMGLSQRNQTITKAIESIKRTGTGTGASRNISGTRPIHLLLEKEIRETYGAQDALLYTSGNNANSDIISCISRTIPNSIFFSDSENHASLIDPMRGLSSARKKIFKHNDTNDLRISLSNFVDSAQVPVIVVESLYSMTGNWCPLNTIVEIAKRFEAILVVNEVHAAGVVGEKGAGLASRLNLLNDVHVVVGSLSKAYGSIGGYLVGDELLIDTCRQSGTRSIFTTALPEVNCTASYENFVHLKNSAKERQELKKRVNFLRRLLTDSKINVSGDDDSHIIPIRIGSEKITRQVTQELLTKGFYVTAISYPTVKKGEAMLRISVNPTHKLKQLEEFVNALANVLPQALKLN